MSVACRVVLAGFAIFSMIFGSSNIVFPLIIGKNFLSNFHIASLGWICSAVIIPMAGYYASMLYDADNSRYLAPIGKAASAIFIFLLMAMLTPVISRGINVSFGGVHVLMPQIPTVLFNAIYSMVTLALALNPGKLVQILGVIFTPLKFGGVIIVILGAIYFFPTAKEFIASDKTAVDSFINSFFIGYQTMDLIPSFVMSSAIFIYIKNSLALEQQGNKKTVLKFGFLACIVGALVLSVVYCGFIYVGALYAPMLQSTADVALFAKIAEIALGAYASWFVAIVVAACCLATNIALTSVVTEYIYTKIFKTHVNRIAILVSVTFLTFVLSLMGFDAICGVLGWILSKIYPFMILFATIRILVYYCSAQKK